MFDILCAVEEELPTLLTQRDWHSLHVTYEPPEVERVWRQWGKYRVLLHRIHPPPAEAKPLFHPHPWPSIVKVLAGQYEMGVGYGTGLAEPPLAMKLVVGKGSTYAMEELDAWHYVRPLETPSYSLMVTGVPWTREMPRADHPPQGPLEPSRLEHLLQVFGCFYPSTC